MDFSQVANPHSSWAYGYGSVGTSFALLTDFGPNDVTVPSWIQPGNGGHPPYVGLNTSGRTVSVSTVNVFTNVLDVHPGPDSDVIIRWIAPEAGTYSVSGLFELLDIFPTGVTGHVYVNSTDISSNAFGGGTGVLMGPGSTSTGPGQTELFSFLLPVLAGDAISFAVSPNNTYFNDSTGFAATISPVPEPATLVLASLGVVLLCLKRMRTWTADGTHSRFKFWSAARC